MTVWIKPWKRNKTRRLIYRLLYYYKHFLACVNHIVIAATLKGFWEVYTLFWACDQILTTNCINPMPTQSGLSKGIVGKQFYSDPGRDPKVSQPEAMVREKMH